MKVLIPGLSGFCPGVKAAERRIFNELNTNPENHHSVMGMMINNRKYIEYLQENCIETIQGVDEIDRGSTLFIRTHGMDKTLQKSLSPDFNLIDLTCSNVKRVQKIIAERSEAGAIIFITGKKSHPEVIGLKSYGENTIVFENETDLSDFIETPVLNGRKFKQDDFSELFITSQTTGNRTFFENTLKKIQSRWPEANLNYFNSICPVTEKKESEALKLQKDADISFVIGDPLSSNASKLFKLLKTADKNTWFIQDIIELKELKLNLQEFCCALVVSSASTPEFVESKVVNYLENI